MRIGRHIMDTDVLFALREHTRTAMREDGAIGKGHAAPTASPSQMEDHFFKEHPDVGIITHELEANKAGYHSYPHFEINYIVSGSCQMDLENGERITLGRGNIIIFNPNSSHCCTISDSGDNIIVIVVKPALFNAAFFSFFDEANSISDFFANYLMSRSSVNYMIFNNEYNPDTDRIMEMLIRFWLSQDPFATTELKSSLVLLFSQILLHQSPGTDDNPKDPEFASIISYMTNHLQTVTLSSTAEHFHYHPNYLSAYMRKHAGRTFSSILTELRLVQAKYYLTSTDLPVSEIVSLVGYQDPSSFNAMFRKNTGYTPGKFRELQTED